MIDQTHLDRLIIFPLPSVVLYPGTHLPLHIFEPRYRSMLEDALAEDLPIAMAQIDRQAGQDTFGQPGVHPVVGIGRIDRHKKTADGRYLVLLRGLARARLDGEHVSALPYRTAKAVLLEDVPVVDEERMSDLLKTLNGLVMALRSCALPLADFLASEIKACSDTTVLTYRLAGAVLKPDVQQALLVEDRPDARLESIVDQVSTLLVARMPRSTRQPN